MRQTAFFASFFLIFWGISSARAQAPCHGWPAEAPAECLSLRAELPVADWPALEACARLESLALASPDSSPLARWPELPSLRRLALEAPACLAIDWRALPPRLEELDLAHCLAPAPDSLRRFAHLRRLAIRVNQGQPGSLPPALDSLSLFFEPDEQGQWHLPPAVLELDSLRFLRVVARFPEPDFLARLASWLSGFRRLDVLQLDFLGVDDSFLRTLWPAPIRDLRLFYLGAEPSSFDGFGSLNRISIMGFDSKTAHRREVYAALDSLPGLELLRLSFLSADFQYYPKKTPLELELVIDKLDEDKTQRLESLENLVALRLTCPLRLFPSGIGRLRHLRHLDLRQAHVADWQRLAQVLGALPELKSLVLDARAFLPAVGVRPSRTDAVHAPAELSQFQHLERLEVDCRNHALGGAIRQEIVELLPGTRVEFVDG